MLEYFGPRSRARTRDVDGPRGRSAFACFFSQNAHLGTKRETRDLSESAQFLILLTEASSIFNDTIKNNHYT